MHIFEMVQNSINAGSKNIYVFIEENTHKNTFKIVIEDDGKGIKPEDLEHVKDIFFTTRPDSKREIGIGISLLNAACEATNGKLVIESEFGSGTKLVASMEHDNVDRPPLGDLPELFTSLIIDTPNKNINWKFEHKFNIKRYSIDTHRLMDILKISSFTAPGIKPSVLEYFRQKEENIQV
jgi:anti-sigma regulatory factor (Ser/Thr protein kinase)